MSAFSRFAVAFVLFAGSLGVAHAQSRHTQSQSQTAPESYYAISEGRSGVVDSSVTASGAVPPSEGQTVMGLRVPR